MNSLHQVALYIENTRLGERRLNKQTWIDATNWSSSVIEYAHYFLIKFHTLCTYAYDSIAAIDRDIHRCR